MSTGVLLIGELERGDPRKHGPLAFADVRRETRRQRQAWERVRNAERDYARQLRKIANQIEDIVRTFGTDTPDAIDSIILVLTNYSRMLTPWAQAVAKRLLFEVSRRDDRAWRAYAKLMGEDISAQLQTAPLGPVYADLMAQQVDLITSLPRQAAQRVHELVTQRLYEGGRAHEISTAIMQTGYVTRSRADLIARTETARAGAKFQQARAKAIGVESYQWVTAMDQRVRPLHRKLHGKVFKYDNPPIIGENGERGHPGEIYNCRCISEPVLPRLY